MEDAVTVAGIEVTQESLERMFADLRAHHWFGIPQRYKPLIGRFGPVPGEARTATLEQVVYEYMESGSMPRWFAEAHMGRGGRRKAPRVDPEEVMRDAGFPPILWAVRRPWDQPTPQQLAEWASHVGEPTCPWAWITCADGFRRAQALAQAAIAAGSGATYARAAEVCERVGSAPLYGEDNRTSRLQPYKDARLLLLDGLGDERHGAPEADALCALIKSRHERMLPTVLASDVGPDKWAGGHRASGRQASETMAACVAAGLRGYGTRGGPGCLMTI